MTFDKWIGDIYTKNRDAYKKLYPDVTTAEMTGYFQGHGDGADDAWDNRQALIDQHNKRCEAACGDRVYCSITAGACPDCPQRWMITEGE